MGRMIPKRNAPNLDLLRLRIEKHLSAEALGRQAGVSAKTIRAIEAGRVARPHIETKARLVKALDADILVVFPLEREVRR